MEYVESANLNGLRVLVVDDNIFFRTLMFEILLDWNARPETVENGAKAIEILEHKPFDVILMDIQMPGMDGYETTRMIRALANQLTRSLPVLAYSTCPDPEKIQNCKMNGQVSKNPIDRMELYEKVSVYMTIGQNGAN